MKNLSWSSTAGAVVLVVSSLFFWVTPVASTTLQPPPPFAVAAYLPEWRYEGAHWETIAQHTTHLILFSLEISPSGGITAVDRFPRPSLYAEARTATQQHNCKLLICFGGNGRSSGFAPMTRFKSTRTTFLNNLQRFMDKYQLDGVDYNWEYPGYQMGRGYLSPEKVEKEYRGLLDLLKETRQVLGTNKTITMSYYPDGRQEALLVEKEATKYVDLFHAMAYDKGGQHSTMELFEKATTQALSIFGPQHRANVTIGLPFYGRSVKTGDWKSYEDLVQQNVLTNGMNQINDQYFNGVDMIRQKVRHGVQQGVGGVMIWEVGQDCRVVEKKTGDVVHVVTCPKRNDSLLLAISKELATGTGSAPSAARRTRSGVDKTTINDKEEL